MDEFLLVISLEGEILEVNALVGDEDAAEGDTAEGCATALVLADWDAELVFCFVVAPATPPI